MVVTINNLESNTADGIVTTVHWTATLVNGEFTGSSYGSVGFTRDEDSAALIPFADLTEADVVGWLDLDEGLEASLQAQIDEQKTPKTSYGMPWTPPMEEEEVVVV